MKFINYIKESFAELKNNVSWPTLIDGQKLTVIVAVFSILFSLTIFVIDKAFSGVIKQYFVLIN